MQHVLMASAATLFMLCFSSPAFAGSRFQQQPGSDTVSKKIIEKICISVKDLMDGTPLDSVLVNIGSHKGFTNKNGIAEFDSIIVGNLVFVSKSGYLAQSGKAKPVLQFRLSKREFQSAASNYRNGLYERPIEHFAGSAIIVTGNDLRKINPLNFVEALKYYDPSFIVSRDNRYGDDPNTAASVKIRGAYNFPASATIANPTGNPATGVQLNPSTADYIANNIMNPDQPVVLLNGMQVSLQNVLDLDINRIEKITILKDAAATSVYGVRGGNGVLFIQTKLPQKGTLNVTYSGQLQLTTADLSSYQLMGSSVKLQTEQSAGMYAGNPSLYQNRLTQVNNGVNTNWLAVPTRTGIGNKQYLSLEGGDDDMMYGLDFSYNSIQGTMKGSERKNLNFGGYINTRIKNLLISNYLTYLQSNAANSPYGNFADYARQNSYWNPNDAATGGQKKILEEYTYQGNSFRFYNPTYNGTLSTTDEHQYARISSLTTLNWMIGSGFQIDGKFGISKQADEHNTFLPPGHTFYADFSPNDFFKRGQYNQTASEFFNWEANLNLNYSRKINRHQFYGSAGATAMETKSESAGIAMIGFSSDKLSDLAFGNAYSNLRPTTGKIITRLASGYGNFTYSYDNRYLVDVSGNIDASSQFAENNRFAPHWSAAASWNLHHEHFFHTNNIVNQLRLRASLGVTGNQYFQSYLGKTNYNYYTDRQYITSLGGLATRGIGLGAYLTGFANNNLKAPETQKQNIGLEAVLLQNRLAIRIDAYKNRTKNIVLPVTSPSSTGFLNITYYDNLGAIESKGVEFDLNYTLINNSRKGINWSLRLNGLHNRDRITAASDYMYKLNAANDAMQNDQTRPQPRYVVGQSLTGIWAVRSLGIDAATGQEKFVKADGSQTTVWDAADKINAGDLSPNWLGSFGSVVAVKNISAGIYFNYQFGGKYYNQTLADRLENADLTYNVDTRAAANRWTQAGSNALYKQLSANGLLTSPTYATTRFVEDNNFINCSAISVDYKLAQRIVQKIKAKNITLGLIGNNLFRSGTMKAERGIYYPFQRMYSFSITAGF